MKRGQTDAPKLIEDLIGVKFGMLTVIGFDGFMDRVEKYQTARYPLVKVTCECGKVISVHFRSLKTGNTKSCGCKRLENRTKSVTTHGQSNTKMYHNWFAMLRRCRDKSHYDYHLYGGRGIKVCERWLKYENFLADVGEKPSPIHTIDRFPNFNGDYEPNNFRWATPKEQATNRRTTIFYEINGVKKSITDWSDLYNIHKSTVLFRLRSGLSFLEALTKPVRKII